MENDIFVEFDENCYLLRKYIISKAIWIGYSDRQKIEINDEYNV